MSRTRIAQTRSTRQTARAQAALISAGESDERLAEMLDEQGLWVASFERPEELLEQADRTDYAAIVLCVDCAPSALARLVGSLAQVFVLTPIVVIHAKIERWEVRAALAAGAAGVVLHDSLDSALAPCLQAVRAGQTCVPRAYWRQIDPPALSAREKQILGLVVMGYMNGQIAEQLFLAESTVKSHLSSAFSKLGVHSRHEAVDLILDSERGLGMGILALGGEPLESVSTATS